MQGDKDRTAQKRGEGVSLFKCRNWRELEPHLKTRWRPATTSEHFKFAETTDTNGVVSTSSATTGNVTKFPPMMMDVVIGKTLTIDA